MSTITQQTYRSALAAALLALLTAAVPGGAAAQTVVQGPATVGSGCTGYGISFRMGGSRDQPTLDGYPVISRVAPDSPAARAGMVAGDTLVAVAGRDMLAGPVEKGTFAPGRRVAIRIKRGGTVHDLELVAGRNAPRPVSLQYDSTSSRPAGAPPARFVCELVPPTPDSARTP